MIRVLLADDHPIVIRGLRSLLGTESDISVVGAAVNGAEVVQSVLDLAPDCLLIDLQMPQMTGLEVLEELGSLERMPPTILIAATIEPWEIMEAERLGAWGVITKDEAPRVIVECIHSALDGEKWEGRTRPRPRPKPDQFGSLSARERQIADLVATGASNKAIARHLEIANGTVKAHLHRIYKKLDVPNRVRLSLLWQEQLRGDSLSPS